ncbi:MAG: hypothetical protein LBC81_01875 [Tannerellaceae bacterium]|nr:hypothetical protein [Tannerellaceae bacterium]
MPLQRLGSRLALPGEVTTVGKPPGKIRAVLQSLGSLLALPGDFTIVGKPPGKIPAVLQSLGGLLAAPGKVTTVGKASRRPPTNLTTAVTRRGVAGEGRARRIALPRGFSVAIP